MTQPDETAAGPHTPDERRRAHRFPVHAKAILRKAGGKPIPAVAVNISSTGMFVRPDRPTSFHIGEELTVDVELAHEPDKSFSAWGLGRVVRLENGGSAVQLCAGAFE